MRVRADAVKPATRGVQRHFHLKDPEVLFAALEYFPDRFRGPWYLNHDVDVLLTEIPRFLFHNIHSYSKVSSDGFINLEYVPIKMRFDLDVIKFFLSWYLFVSPE